MSPDGFTKPTPEERLLKLIRGKALPPHAQPPSGSAGLASGLGARGRTRGWFRTALVLLGAVLGGEVVWLAIQLVRPLPEIAMPPAASAPPAAAAASAVPAEPVDAMPSVAASAARPMFAAPAGGAASGASRTAPSESANLLASRLTLMGIISSDPPQAIIEDAQAQKTYFVTVGQALVDGALLDRVLENRVILDYHGEKIELNL